MSLEGGGCLTHDGVGVAHFLVDDGSAAARAWRASGFDVVAVREVVRLSLDQGTPGQLGLLCREMAEAGWTSRSSTVTTSTTSSRRRARPRSRRQTRGRSLADPPLGAGRFTIPDRAETAHRLGGR